LTLLEQVLKEAEEKMKKSLVALQREYQSLRAGKANPSFLDKVAVNYYDSLMPLNQVATIASPEARLLTVAPWDASLLKDIEKAILKANLGVTPQSDGRVIRVAFPPLTEERRRELVKLAKKYAEEFRVELRNHRRLANEEIKELKEKGKTTEDERDRALERVQKLLEKYTTQIDETLSKKEQQIMEV
jgi:ribosome recycling factor